MTPGREPCSARGKYSVSVPPQRKKPNATGGRVGAGGKMGTLSVTLANPPGGSAEQVPLH